MSTARILFTGRLFYGSGWPRTEKDPAMTARTRPEQPIKFYTFAISGHAHRVELALSLLKVPFERIEIDLPGREHKSEAFLARNPFGQVPVIEDGDVTLGDSNSILVYLAKRYDATGRWLPEDPVGAARVQRWFSVAAGELYNGPTAARGYALFRKKPVPDDVVATANRLFVLLEQHLSKQPFLAAATPTLADIAIYSYTALCSEGRLSLEPYPEVRSWLARIEALPGFVPVRRSPLPEPKEGTS
jgi:glutathione S-transferase